MKKSYSGDIGLHHGGITGHGDGGGCDLSARRR